MTNYKVTLARENDNDNQTILLKTEMNWFRKTKISKIKKNDTLLLK